MAERKRPKEPFDSVRYGTNHRTLRRQIARVVTAGAGALRAMRRTDRADREMAVG
jgi:hypothetical protein